MRGVVWLAGMLALAAGGASVAAGCGESTKTVSVSSLPPTPVTSTAAPTSSTATVSTTTSATSMTAQATRTASAPAFTRQSPTTTSASTASAAATVRSRGYTPQDVSQYHSAQTLRVLVGTRTGSGDGYGQQAFFFVGGRYIGTDSSQPSASVRVVAQGDTEVTLAYPLYRPHDPLSSPSGGEAKVTFQLNDGRLTPLQTIPPASSSTGLSRQ